MSASLSLCPEPLLDPPLDPWWDLYLPATLGERDRVRMVIDTLGPVDAELQAVAARALEVLGYTVEARRLAVQSMRDGGDEALALATFLMPEGLQIAELRIQRLKLPGLQADAACDAAALELLRGQPEAALERVEQAMILCPDHREAARWCRFLTQEEAVRVLRRYRRDVERVARLPGGRDVVELVPSRAKGWVSPERLRRRLLHTLLPGGARGSALRRLQQAGVMECWFALPSQYGQMPEDHGLAGLELLADELVARVEEERVQGGLGSELLEEAAAVDGEAAEDALRLLLALCTRAPVLEEVGRAAVAGRGAGWDPWRCWLERDVEGARRLLQRSLGPLPWQVAVDTLRRGGEGEEAEQWRRRGLELPLLAGVAEQLRKKLVVVPVPRLVARGAGRIRVG